MNHAFITKEVLLRRGISCWLSRKLFELCNVRYSKERNMHTILVFAALMFCCLFSTVTSTEAQVLECTEEILPPECEGCIVVCPCQSLRRSGDPTLNFMSNKRDWLHAHVLLTNPDGTPWRGVLLPDKKVFSVELKHPASGWTFEDSLGVGNLVKVNDSPLVFKYQDKNAPKRGGFDYVYFRRIWMDGDFAWEVQFVLYDNNPTDDPYEGFAPMNTGEDELITFKLSIGKDCFSVTAWWIRAQNRLNLLLDGPQ